MPQSAHQLAVMQCPTALQIDREQIVDPRCNDRVFAKSPILITCDCEIECRV